MFCVCVRPPGSGALAPSGTYAKSGGCRGGPWVPMHSSRVRSVADSNVLLWFMGGLTHCVSAVWLVALYMPVEGASRAVPWMMWRGWGGGGVHRAKVCRASPSW